MTNKSNEPVVVHCFTISGGGNGHEHLYLSTTRMPTDDSDTVYYNQSLTLNSENHSASIELGMAPLTPKMLRKMADELEAAMAQEENPPTEEEDHGPRHPTQPVVASMEGGHEVYRFKRNEIVHKFYEMASEGRKYDLNDVAMGRFTKEDRAQFDQLIGFSVSGWGGMQYVTDEDYDLAQKEVEKMEKRNGIK